MKILIAADMEGISGVVRFDQTDPSHPEYQRFRRLMTADINAAIKGAALAGAEEFLVTDGHWNGDNVLIEELDGRASLNSGNPSPLSMVEGAAAGVAGVFFIGYHARAGTAQAILDHTWSSSRVANMWLNGRLTGETGLNGSVCAHFGVPVLLATGDQSLCAEAQDWVPGIETAQVKRAHSRHAAECLPLEQARSLISQAAERAVRRLAAGAAPTPLKVPSPVNITLEFINTDMADRVAGLPGSRRLDGRRVEVQAVSMPEAYQAMRAAIALASR